MELCCALPPPSPSSPSPHLLPPPPIKEELAAQLQGMWSVGDLQLSALSWSLVFQGDLGSPEVAAFLEQPHPGTRWSRIQSPDHSDPNWTLMVTSCSRAPPGRLDLHCSSVFSSAPSVFFLFPSQVLNSNKYHTPPTPSKWLILENSTLNKASQIPLPIFMQSTRKGNFPPQRLPAYRYLSSPRPGTWLNHILS